MRRRHRVRRICPGSQRSAYAHDQVQAEDREDERFGDDDPAHLFLLSRLGSVGAGAIELLVEAPGVEGARGGRDAAEDREGDQG